LLRAVPTKLDGLKVVVDCANGAASQAAPEAYRRAGAEVIAINAEPDGININEDCGSTHLEGLQAAVVEHGADLGIARDGEAVRCKSVDAKGEDVGGEQIMAVLALSMAESGELTDQRLVARVMSNLGLYLAMRKHCVKLKTTAVGARYVLEALRS